MAETIKVVCRFRGGQDSEDSWYFAPNGETVKSPGDAKKAKQFTFDRVLNSDSTQEMAYIEAGRGTVQALLGGFNGTIFAYGQSGSGKTFTMLGPDSVVDAIKNGGEGISLEVQKMYGVIPRAIGDIFDAINRVVGSESAQIELSVQYLEIYNEKIQDLLSKGVNAQQQDLRLRELPNGQMLVTGCEHKTVQTFDDIFEALMFGQRSRAVASTNQNDRSSRSHTIFVISYKQLSADGAQKQGRLNLVDLAGSERIAKTGATGKTLQEAQKINLSLTALGLVIKALTDGKGHIPFRDSKLTLLLKDALGGNSKTTLICTASKQLRHLEESVQTLQFAERAKRIKNKAAANVMRSPEEMAKMIEKLKAEVAALKAQLLSNGLQPALANAKALEALEKEEAKVEEQQSTSLSTSVAATQAQSEEISSISISKEQEEKKGEVSFNTLLNDSSLSFNPENEPRNSKASSEAPATDSQPVLSPPTYQEQERQPVQQLAAPVSKQEDLVQISSLTAQLDEQQMKLSELENEYEHYRAKTQTEMIQLRDQNDTMQGKLAAMPNVDDMLGSLKEQQFIVTDKEAEIERLKQDFQKQLKQKQEEITNLSSTITFKDEYIKDLEEQNDEFRGELEKIGYETFIQVKNDLFSKDQLNERLADRKQYMPIYEEFEKETTMLMEKYTQQESTIQNLQNQNQVLIEQLQSYEEGNGARVQVMSEGSSESQATEMMEMRSERSYSSSHGGSQFNFRGKSNPTLKVVAERDSENEPNSGTRTSRARDSDHVPTMEELIEEAKESNTLIQSQVVKSKDFVPSIDDLIEEAKDKDAQKYRNSRSRSEFDPLMIMPDRGSSKRRTGSLVVPPRQTSQNNHDSGVSFGSNRSSMFCESDASSVMLRGDASSRNGSEVSEQMEKPGERVVDNTRLSALTNQIMELVLDNIKMLHINQKLIDYSKRQTLQSKISLKTMEVKVEHSAITQEHTSEDLAELQALINELRSKNESLQKTLENERNQYQRTIREKQQDLRTKLSDLNSELRAEKQKMFRFEIENTESERQISTLRQELVEIKASEKKLKAELNKEKLNCQQVLQELMRAQQQQKGGNIGAKEIAKAKPLGYERYLARAKVGGVITNQVGMSSKFMDYTKLNESQTSSSLTASQRRAPVGAQLNPLNFSGKSATPRSSVRLTNANIEQMMTAAIANANTPAAIEEEVDVDHTADAHDELDEMMNDFSSSEGSNKDN